MVGVFGDILSVLSFGGDERVCSAIRDSRGYISKLFDMRLTTSLCGERVAG